MKEKRDLVEYWEKTGIIEDQKLLDAFMSVPREEFILEDYRDRAYGDYPLPIGEEQSISQPTTVMSMLKYLKVKPHHKVLEVGAGSGYNAAILSKLCKKVYTIELIESLLKFAKDNLKKTGIKNVEVIYGDGSKGYKEAAPYDRIIITAACPRIPKPVFNQLKFGGIVIAPVGSIYSQVMTWVLKTEKGYKERELGGFRFVKLKGEYGF